MKESRLCFTKRYCTLAARSGIASNADKLLVELNLN
jgi:hypothetical protein